MVPIYGFYFATVNRLFGNVAVNAMTADITNRECRRFSGFLMSAMNDRPAFATVLFWRWVKTHPTHGALCCRKKIPRTRRGIYSHPPKISDKARR